METVLEYYLVNGKIRIGKKELAFELLRKDSILGGLLGFKAGNLGSMLSNAAVTDEEDYAVIDFQQRDALKLDDDPTPILNELKQRYGDRIGGTLSFNLFYKTHKTVAYLEGNLDMDTISLMLGGK